MSDPPYLLGHAEPELARLQRQAALFRPITEESLAAAGLRPGSKVLDIGCGAGDVSLLVAGMLGKNGSVVGIDRSPAAVATARGRAATAGVANAVFYAGDVVQLDAIAALPPGTAFDAIVGRFVLMHQADPAATLRAATRHLRPGGLVVMIESAFSACVRGFHSTPHSPAYDRVLGLITRVIAASGADAAMGVRLAAVFGGAGLSQPSLRLHACVSGAGDTAIRDFIADSARSILPAGAALGIDGCAARDIDAMVAELSAEIAASAAVLVSPPLVTAWARTPVRA